MKKLSIIIPIYNAESFIAKTLTSIIKDICDYIEVILVDDGSSDNSINIINNKFKKELDSKQFILITQPNLGVSVARNNGISIANGQYITFVDADDFILDGYYEHIINSIDNYSADIIEFGCKKFEIDTDITSSKSIYTHNEFGFLKTKDVINDVFLTSIFYPWLRVIKSKFFKNNTFPVGVELCEDMMLLQKIYNESESIYHLHEPLYAYRKNPKGATMNPKGNYIINMLKFYESLLDKPGLHYQYLRVNAFYVIYKCMETLNIKYSIPTKITNDRKDLFLRLVFDRRVPIKNKIILLSPNIYKHLVNFKTMCTSKT